MVILVFVDSVVEEGRIREDPGHLRFAESISLRILQTASISSFPRLIPDGKYNPRLAILDEMGKSFFSE